MKITKAQQSAIKRIYDRKDLGISYLQFRRSVKHGFDCLMVEWSGMWLGIESDGYTHS
jgi:hypothetical protein